MLSVAWYSSGANKDICTRGKYFTGSMSFYFLTALSSSSSCDAQPAYLSRVYKACRLAVRYEERLNT